MHRIVATFTLVLATSAPAFANWSVMAVDRRTGTIVVASAACVAQRAFAPLGAKGLMDIQTIVVPGTAVAVAQGDFDSTRVSQKLIYQEIGKGTDPETVLFMLRQDPEFGMRQVAILDVEGHHVAFSGPGTRAVSEDAHGQVPGTTVWYSVQGNTLANSEVVPGAVQALTEYHADLADRVMAAMEAADAKGGDNRCSCASEPKVNAPCEAKTAQVAYMLRAEKNDSNRTSFNDGNYAMYLSVSNDDIKPNENANPVKTLRIRYDAWKRARPN